MHKEWMSWGANRIWLSGRPICIRTMNVVRCQQNLIIGSTYMQSQPICEYLTFDFRRVYASQYLMYLYEIFSTSRYDTPKFLLWISLKLDSVKGTLSASVPGALIRHHTVSKPCENCASKVEWSSSDISFEAAGAPIPSNRANEQQNRVYVVSDVHNSIRSAQLLKFYSWVVQYLDKNHHKNRKKLSQAADT